ncbi:patatin-like phospholipase family protein [Dechloromonas sp.]|uniref:patatin-like phospholipase family protein n=1 Tax=Dechloromonas sp. TaxID=1917218 RepID=UPI00121F6043|nr:patatin-like phospholipase family protein [Dechloromonas sp.]MBU3697888.1 patatin-like phospholipase family protein [Dechloromonas sp.]TEX49954.1 MAG: esterase [Rhodocyclaceae bacterium]
MIPLRLPHLLLIVVALVAGCATPRPEATPKPAVTKPKIGLALGGGAARGFAHIGVVKMLEAHGIVPDYIVGTSAGAVVGALYAAGHDAFAMQKIGQQLDEKIFADWTLGGRGLLKGEALQDFINQQVGKRPLEKLNKPFAAVATDLNNGERVVFRTGDTGLAVRASAAVPGVFQPAQFRGHHYVDGGLTSPVPVQAAREMGADIVIAVDISARPEGQPVDSLTAIIWQTTTIMGGMIGANELKGADVVIRPKLPYVKSWDFTARNDAMLEGERAALTALPTLRQKLGR